MTRRTTLTFLGGAGTVTGSKFLLSGPDARVLVDCGLFQGLKRLRLRNWQPLPVPGATIDAVVVSHAHLDHVGYLPALVRQGFAGPVYCSRSTAQLAQIILSDSAKLMQEDADYAAKRGYSKHARPQPLYTADDVEATIPLLRPIDFDDEVPAIPGVRLMLRPAGHILGSASPWIRMGAESVLFSGDLGRASHPLLRPPEPPPAVDAIVVESTYGNRSHSEVPSDALASAINRTVARGGSVLIPAFAVDRTEVLLLMLRRLKAEGSIPDVPVYVDSPMALRALAVYRRALRDGAGDLRGDLDTARDIFDPGGLREAHSADDSARLNNPGQPCIIISASGMATGGRILHHLKHMLPDPRHTVACVGFQAAGTRGRALLEGASQVKMHGIYVPVRAEVVDLSGFSVHADGDEIISWLSRAPEPPGVVYVVHGEPDASAVLATRIRRELGVTAVVPGDGEVVRVVGTGGVRRSEVAPGAPDRLGG